jgi:thiamine-phosphate pyrophosphorylase
MASRSIMTAPPSSLAEAVCRLKGPPVAGAERALPRLFLMTDRQRLADPETAVRALPRGSGVIVREPDRRHRRLLAARLAPLCRRRHLVLLIAGDPRLALCLGAAGVHWPESALRRHAAAAGHRRRSTWLVTAAAHSAGAVRRAAAAGVDAIFISPVFPTASHPGAPCLGPLRFARLARLSPVLVYALGGITAAAVRRLKGAGAAGYAAVGALTNGGPYSGAGSS